MGADSFSDLIVKTSLSLNFWENLYEQIVSAYIIIINVSESSFQNAFVIIEFQFIVSDHVPNL